MTIEFHRIAVVDWSAQSTPKTGPDSIWVAVLDCTRGTTELTNPATRREAGDLLARITALPGRTLLGIDATLGFPSGPAAAMGLSGPPWQSMWACIAERIDDGPLNRNNRWQVAADLNRAIGSPQFWGTPAAHAHPWLPTRRPAEHPLPTWRAVEDVIRARGRRPFSVWQLLGAGSVGSQTLTAIPMLHRLRATARPGAVRIWPFDTGLTTDPFDTVDTAATVDTGAAGGTVIAEVWPSAVPSDHVDHPVKDARQVTALTHHLQRLLADDAPLFDPPSARPNEHAVVDEEGWVLGVT